MLLFNVECLCVCVSPDTSHFVHYSVAFQSMISFSLFWVNQVRTSKNREFEFMQQQIVRNNGRINKRLNSSGLLLHRCAQYSLNPMRTHGPRVQFDGSTRKCSRFRKWMGTAFCEVSVNIIIELHSFTNFTRARIKEEACNIQIFQRKHFYVQRCSSAIPYRLSAIKYNRFTHEGILFFSICRSVGRRRYLF